MRLDGFFAGGMYPLPFRDRLGNGASFATAAPVRTSIRGRQRKLCGLRYAVELGTGIVESML